MSLMISFSSSIVKRQVGVACTTGSLIKQEARNMLSEECAILYNLHRWKQHGRGAIQGGSRTCTREATHLARADSVIPGLTC